MCVLHRQHFLTFATQNVRERALCTTNTQKLTHFHAYVETISGQIKTIQFNPRIWPFGCNKVAAQMPQFRRYCYFNFNAKCLNWTLLLIGTAYDIKTSPSIDGFNATSKMNWHVYLIYNILWYLLTIVFILFAKHCLCWPRINAILANLLLANH